MAMDMKRNASAWASDAKTEGKIISREGRRYIRFHKAAELG